MGQSQHGYQINEFIEKNLNTITDMKKPTAYASLDKLSANDFIDIKHEQEGNRPPRKVYSTNEKGRTFFNELLIENLISNESYQYQGDIGLMFIDYLSYEPSAELLKVRLDKNYKVLQQYMNMPIHSLQTGVNLAIKHKKMMLQAEMQFLEKTIDELKNKHK